MGDLEKLATMGATLAMTTFNRKRRLSVLPAWSSLPMYEGPSRLLLLWICLFCFRVAGNRCGFAQTEAGRADQHNSGGANGQLIICSQVTFKSEKMLLSGWRLSLCLTGVPNHLCRCTDLTDRHNLQLIKPAAVLLEVVLQFQPIKIGNKDIYLI